MVVDVKKDISPLFTRDWTQMNNGAAFFQKATYEYPPQGITTQNERHIHQYEVDENGNGWTLEAVDPSEPRIHHKHKIKNWVVESAESNCWPDCDQLDPPPDGVPPAIGVPPHIHLFPQPETPTLVDRYSAVVVTDATTTDGVDTRLAEIKNSALTPGFASLLKFYNKDKDDLALAAASSIFVEDWYLSERPFSKIKILISIPMELLDGLNGQPPPEIISKATEEIYLNTSTMEKKIKGVVALLHKFSADIESFHGKISGMDLAYQIKLLGQFTSQVSILVQANNFTFDRSRSDLLAFGIDDEYKVLYGQWNPGTCFVDLSTDFNTFQESPPVSDDRTVHLLSNLDEIYRIYSKDEKYSWSKFLEDYMLNPPEINFSELPRRSDATSKKTAETEKRASKSVMTEKEFQLFQRDTDYNPGYKADTKRKLDSAADFVGDTMVSGLGSVVDGLTTLSGYATRNPGNYLADGVWKDILNKIPIQNLIAAAMECLGFRGFEYVNLSKQFLNQTSGYLEDVAKLFDIPALNFPDNFPVADYMKGLGKKIAEALLNAVMSVLIEALVGIIEELLNLCNECALQNEAAGLSPHDGLNFGGLDLGKEFGQALGGGILGTITTTIARGTQIEQLSAQVHAETEAHAKNPLLIVEKGDVDWAPNDSERKRIQQETEETKKEFGDFMRASSTVLTPGEMGNMLLGCGVGQAPLNAVEELMKAFPRINAIAGADPTTPHNFIIKLFGDFGKLLGPNPILQKVKEATEAIPVELQCLTDVDDLALRTKLLSEKGLNIEQVNDQVKKSQDRKKRKLKELSAMLEKDNLLDGVLPDIYCKTVYRKADGTIIPNEKVMVHPIAGSTHGISHDQFISKETGEELFKGVKQGLMEKDPPSFIFMMDQVLDTIYDGITMNFNQDISNFIPILTKGTTDERRIPRTVLKEVNGRTELHLNQEWVSLVKNPDYNYSFGVLSAEAVVPGGTYRMTADDASFFAGYGGGVEAGKIRDADDRNFVGNDPRLTVRQNLAMAAGQMEMGSEIPSAQQEAEWEIMNRVITRTTEVDDTGDPIITEGKDNSTNLGRRRVTEYGNSPGERRLREYSQKFGYSPIPITIKERGEQILAPGLKEAFRDMCLDKELFSVYDDNQFQIYSFNVPNNVFQAAGVNYADISNALNPENASSGDPVIMGGTPGGGNDAQIREGASKAMEALRFINSSRINLRYVVPFSRRSYLTDLHGLPQDKYDVALTMDSQAAGSINIPSLVLYMSTEEKPLKTPITNVLSSIDSVVSDGSYTHQEKYFTALNEDIWKGGGAIYQNGEALSDGARPDYAQGTAATTPQLQNLGRFYLENKFGPAAPLSSSYDCLWKNFYCSLTNTISNSPFLDLKKMATINLTPMNEMGQTCDLFQGLLDVELIKQRVKKEYGLVQCIETCFPNVDGEGTNKDNPFEKANLGGAVLLTIRTYVLEVLLRSIFVFYYFRFSSAEEIDSLLVSYIAQSIKKDITEKQFIEEFISETIKLYNRNAGNLRPVPMPTTSDFDVALNYFVRWQIYGVSNRLAKTVGSIGDTSLDSILVEEWMPSYSIPAKIGSRVFGLTKPDDPDPAGLQVSAGQALALMGEGPLSSGQIRRFNWAGPGNGGVGDLAYTYRYPLGFLFRKYYAFPNQSIDTGAVIFGAASRPPGTSDNRIWSMDGPVNLESANFIAEGASWLGNEAERSKNKRHFTSVSLAADDSVREWWTLYEAGFLMTNPGVNETGRYPRSRSDMSGQAGDITPSWTAAMTVQPLQQPANTPTEPPTTENVEPLGTPEPNPHTPYEYGVSYFEQKAMGVLLRMIAASLPYRALKRTRRENSRYEFETSDASSGNQVITRIYPGYLLKQKTRRDISAANPSHEFRWGDVWDKGAWNNTGREPPNWIKHQGVQSARLSSISGAGYCWAPPSKLYQAGGHLATSPAHDHPTLPRLPLIGGSLIDYNMRYMNNAYFSWVNPLSDIGEQTFEYHDCDRDTKLETYECVRMTWDLRMKAKQGTTDRPEKEGNFARYFYIDGKWIGPWRNDYVATNGTGDTPFKESNGNELYRVTERKAYFTKHFHQYFGKGRWKLTDPTLTAVDSTDAGFTGPGTRMPQLVGATFFEQIRDAGFFDLKAHHGGGLKPSQYENLRRAVDLLYKGMPYLSLLDFDISSIKSILEWEKANFRDMMPNLSEASYTAAQEKYDEWIADLSVGEDSVIVNFDSSHTPPARERMAATLRQAIAHGGVARRETPFNPGKSFDGGNFITEYYLRIEELPYQGIPFDANTPGVRESIGSFSEQISTGQFEEHIVPIEEAKWRNSNFVDVVGRTEFLKGVVNINEFQTYLDSRFDATGQTGDVQPVNAATPDCTPQKLTKALIQQFPQYDECGELQAARLGISVDEHSKWLLGDFFQKVSIGVRISYVTPLKDKDFLAAPLPLATTPQSPVDCWRDQRNDPVWDQLRAPTSTPLEAPFQEIMDNNPWFGLYENTSGGIRTWENAAMKEKAFFVKEQCSGDKEGCTVTGDRWVHVVPIVSVEQEIPKNTEMRDIVHKQFPREVMNKITGVMESKSDGFFINEYYQRLVGDQGLRAELKKTDEFKALFKYFFPINRMLSISNVYSSVYLSSFKGIDGLLDGTKVNLKRLFFSLLQSGNYRASECGPTNPDLQLSALNGLDIEGLATTMALMMVRAAFLIFKGFVEIADINIAVSRKIVDAIHLSNKMIAQAQMMANQAQSIAASIAAMADQGGEIDPETCMKTNLPAKPPDEWFDPIEQNFIWEPPIFMISLALLPITLLPLLWPGLPITPYGIAYWGLDLKPAPAWLQSIPPGDHVDKLLNKGSEVLSSGTEQCTIDIGLPEPE